jgi:hypothetical protein
MTSPTIPPAVPARIPLSWSWSVRIDPETSRTVYLRLDRTDVPPSGRFPFNDTTVLHIRDDWFRTLLRTAEGRAVLALIEAAPEIRTAARDLLDWARENTSPRDPNSPHEILVRLAAALAKAEDPNHA